MKATVEAMRTRKAAAVRRAAGAKTPPRGGAGDGEGAGGVACRRNGHAASRRHAARNVVYCLVARAALPALPLCRSAALPLCRSAALRSAALPLCRSAALPLCLHTHASSPAALAGLSLQPTALGAAQCQRFSRLTRKLIEVSDALCETGHPHILAAPAGRSSPRQEAERAPQTRGADALSTPRPTFREPCNVIVSLAPLRQPRASVRPGS